MGQNPGFDLQDPSQMRDGKVEELQCLQVLHVAHVLAEEGPVSLCQAYRVLQLSTDCKD